MQQYAYIYLLLNYSTCFGRPLRPSSGVHKTVVATSGTDHTIWGASFFKRDHVVTFEEEITKRNRPSGVICSNWRRTRHRYKHMLRSRFVKEPPIDLRYSHALTRPKSEVVDSTQTVVPYEYSSCDGKRAAVLWYPMFGEPLRQKSLFHVFLCECVLTLSSVAV